MPTLASPSRAPDDLFVLTMMGLFGLGAAGTAAAVLWEHVLAWALAHGILVPAAAHPLVAVPNSAGAGADLPRLSIAAAGLLVLFAVTVGVLRRLLLRRLLRRWRAR